MTNLEKLKQLPVEEFAELFVKQVFNSGVIYVYEDYDFDDDDDINYDYWTFITLEGKEHDYYLTEEDAIQACIKYLNGQYKVEYDNKENKK